MDKCKWIDFLLMEQKPKTQVWRVETKEDKILLGIIKWLPRWRKYSFFPTENTVYENQCLKDIANFLEVLMNKHRSQK